MNREIKFRAWDGINKEMVYPQLSANNFGIGNLTSAQILSRFDDEHIMQFIGLLDENGKEIYEGDIYGHDFSNVHNWLVCFENGCFGIKNIGIDGYLTQFFPIYNISFFVDRHYVGNKFDNPELLK